MKKQYTALLAAFLMTACVAAAMLAVSASALVNKHGVPVADSPASATATAAARSAEEAQIQQLQQLVNQYQSRETQYQNELKTAAQNLNQANAQLQEYQQLLMALQERGVISVGLDGRISILR